MKVRNGFVSNSSSSSFIIAKTYIPTEKLPQLRKELENLAERFDAWGESYNTWEEQGNYIYMETYWVYGELNEILERCGIKWSDGYCGET